MKLDLQLFILILFIGLRFRQLSWKGWFGVSVFVFTWMMYNWLKH